MGGKKMEGDENMKRKRAREAREHGHTPSEEGVTTGASKQHRHLTDKAGRDERLESVQHGEAKQAGADVPSPLRGKGRSRDARVGH